MLAKLLLASLLLSGAAVRACPVTDLETPVERLAVEQSGASTARQLTAYREQIIAPNQAVFAEDVIGPFAPDALDASISRSLTDARDPRRAKTVHDVTRALAAATTRFTSIFPDFRCDFPIYFMDSLGSLDGAGRRVAGKPALVLGIDQITREREILSLDLFLAHELFHRYHGRVSGFSDDPGEHQAIWRTLWAEGLATYVSFRMTPGASVDDALIAPSLLRERAQPFVRRIALDLLAHLKRPDHQTYQAYFTYGNEEATNRGLPWRSGYYVGFLVASDIGRHRSLPALARLKGVTLEQEIEAALKRLARVGAATSERRCAPNPVRGLLEPSRGLRGLASGRVLQQ